MKRIRHSPEQIIRKLREADAELAKGVAIPEVCKALGIAENTYYRWRNQFGGIKADAPMCMTCGTKMRPAGSCYVCEGCGSTSGCS